MLEVWAADTAVQGGGGRMTKLKIGDNVVMNDRYYDKHQGEVFTIKAGPEMIGRKECFWLDGYDGAYCADGLDLYKPPTNEEWFCALPTKDKAKWLMVFLPLSKWHWQILSPFLPLAVI